MALATVTHMKDFLGNKADDTPDGVLSLYLDMAKRSVESQGVAVDHPRFKDLHTLYTAHTLLESGAISRDVASESVEGVSTSYFGKGTDADMDSTYLKLYKQVKLEVLGFEGKVSLGGRFS